MKLKKIMTVLLATAVMSSLTVTGCGNAIDQKAVAATLDGKEISMGVANFMAQHQAAQMDSWISYYGEDMWSSDSGDGKTMQDSMKESLMETLQEYYLLDAHTGDYSVTLTDDEKAEITAAAQKFMEDNTSSAIKKMGASQENVEEMLRLNKIHAKMKEAIEAGIDTEVTEEECAQKTFSYVSFTKAETSDTAADDAETSADDDTAADQKADAEAFLSDAADGDMNTLAEEKEYTVSTCSYGSGDLSEDDNSTSLDVSVLKAADKLKNGELADKLVETDSAYYVIRMDNTDDQQAAETKKENILAQRRTELYNEVVDGYKEDCTWEINEEEWAKVNFDDLYTIKQDETDTAADDSANTAADDSANTAADGGSNTAADDSANTAADGGSNTAAGDSSDAADTTAK